MKFATDNTQSSQTLDAVQTVEFPAGIVGFPQFNRAEIVYQPDQLPFMWLRGDAGGDPISFLVVEPAGLVKDYELELSDADVEALDIRESSQALVLNIANITNNGGKKILLNLIGPIVVNRQTLKAKQVIIGNCHKYSARHVLYQEEGA